MSSSNIRALSRFLASALLGGCLLASSGCFRSSVIIPSVPPGDKHSTWVNGWLWGSVGGSVSADNFCGGRPVARVDTKRSLGNILVSWVTLGIYTPSKVFVTCGGQPGGGAAPPPYGYGYDYGYGYYR